MLDFVVLMMLNYFIIQPSYGFGILPCDREFRSKYCGNNTDSRSCLNCQIGPRCPIDGIRRFRDGQMLLRGIDDDSHISVVLDSLNEKRIRESWSNCVPLFSWDSQLAESAQAWADQCAMVEYESDGQSVQRLHHDPKRLTDSMTYARNPGVAQTIHWYKSNTSDLNTEILNKILFESDKFIQEGLIDGLLTEENDTLISWGHTSHVGCGWIQFRTNNSNREYQNFMVCNYGIGIPDRTTCSDVESDPVYDHGAITYFTATSDIIRDVKTCLGAVRCSRQLNPSKRCDREVETCLKSKSGLEFVKDLNGKTIKSVLKPISPRFDDEENHLNNGKVTLKASRCKIDSILCSLNGTSICRNRLRLCLDLLDKEECKCAQIDELSDGTRDGNCDKSNDDPFCYVSKSPCISIGNLGEIEHSIPVRKLNNLIHISKKACLN